MDFHGTKWGNPTELLGNKVKKPQSRQWYVKGIFGDKIYPGIAAGTDLSKINSFLPTLPLNQIGFILKLTNHNLVEPGKKLLTRIILLIFFNYCVTHLLFCTKLETALG